MSQSGILRSGEGGGGGGSTVQFEAFLSSNHPFTASSTAETVVFDGVFTNVGSGYNNTTGVFTAPKTSYYQFNTTLVFIDLNVVSATEIIIAYTGSIQSARLVDVGIGAAVVGVYVTLTGSWGMPMTAGDTVKVQPFVLGTGTYQLAGNNLSSAFVNQCIFSGFSLS